MMGPIICSRFALAATLGLLLAGHAMSQVRRVGNAYQFRAKYVKGSTIAFEMTTLVAPFGSGATAGNQKVTLPVVMRIQDIRKQPGKAGMNVAKIRSEAGPVLLNGKPFREKAVEIVFVDELNRLQEGGNQEVPQFTTPLPEKAIRIGQSWSSTIDPAESIPFSMKVNATYKLTRVTRIFAYVSVTLVGKGTGDSKVSTKGQGTMMLRVRDGTLHSLKMTQTVQASETMGAKSTITVTRRV